MEIQNLSTRYAVRRLTPQDIEEIYWLASGNELFYRYHPPFVTRESLLEDMNALPKGKTEKDKFFIGFFEGERLIAVMDIIMDYPAEKTAWIGWLITAKNEQGKGVGSRIAAECEAYFEKIGVKEIGLAIDKGNPQSAAFWKKNGFLQKDEKIPNGVSAYIPMKKTLKSINK